MNYKVGDRVAAQDDYGSITGTIIYIEECLFDHSHLIKIEAGEIKDCRSFCRRAAMNRDWGYAIRDVFDKEPDANLVWFPPDKITLLAAKSQRIPKKYT